MKSVLPFLLMLTASAQQIPNLSELDHMMARFAPVELKADTLALSEGDRAALEKLIEAARVVNTIFMRQLWSGNLEEYAKLQHDTTPLGRARLQYFWLNKGPWSDLDGHTAFVPGVPERKPLGANFYPEDMTREEFNKWVAGLSPGDRTAATGFFTVIRRDANRHLTMIPYSTEYRADLQHCARLLDEAAALTGNTTLKRFLTERANAFHSNDYYESDLAWMDLDAPLDITIGPYETYNDELFGYKAAYEAYVNIRDEAESQKVQFFSEHLQDIENNLPIEPHYRNPKIGGQAPIRVVNEVFGAGDGAHGVQTAAYNLPNDERVVAQKGSKRVMLKNVQEAKFRAILTPIAGRVLTAEERGDVNFDAFFTHILAHELSHGIGPHQIKVAARTTSPRLELKDLYSAIEEAKADVTGLFMLQYMLDHKLLRGAPFNERQLYSTYLASSFRTLRFGLKEAHAKGMAMQFNYLVDKGGFRQLPDGKFAVDFSKIKAAVRDLDHELLTMEAEGDYNRARHMLDTLGVIRPEVKKVIDGLNGIPVDIRPVFVMAEQR